MPVRPSEHERVLRLMTEKQWTDQVVSLARLHGWLCHHSRSAWVRGGKMVTALQGDKGLPDLLLVKNGQMIVAELKRHGPRRAPLTEEQQTWLLAFAAVPGVRTYVWEPGDLDTVRAILSGKRAT